MVFLHLARAKEPPHVPLLFSCGRRPLEPCATLPSLGQLHHYRLVPWSTSLVSSGTRVQTSNLCVLDSGAEGWDHHSEILAMWKRILFSVWVCRRQVGSPRFQPWPEDALHNVAQKLLGILGMNHSRHCRHQTLVVT